MGTSLLLAGLALAEIMGAESLAWMTADSEAVVRARVVEVQRQPIEGEAWVSETVAIEVVDAIHGAPGAELQWTWRTRKTRSLEARTGEEVLVFLSRGEDGSWGPRSSQGGWLALDGNSAEVAIAADCELLPTGEALVDRVRALPERPLGASASHWTTWSWQRPGATWETCGLDTPAHEALYAGSTVRVLVPEAPGFPGLGERHLYLRLLTDQMHWFEATAIAVERVHCLIGLPVDGGGEPNIGCSYPAGRIEDPDVPRQLRREASEARKLVRQHLGDNAPVRDLRVTWVATEPRAALCDEVLHDNLLWSTGQLSVGLGADGAHLARGGSRSGSGESMVGCVGKRLPWDPPEVADERTSILVADLQGEATAAAATQALLAELPEALAGLEPFSGAVPQQATGPNGLVRDETSGRVRPAGRDWWLPGLPEGDRRVVGTRVRYARTGDGAPVPLGEVVVAGYPSDDAALEGPEVPEAMNLRATVEVFAADPDWTGDQEVDAGFERLEAYTLFGPRR